jgi:hypothetical protein
MFLLAVLSWAAGLLLVAWGLIIAFDSIRGRR